MIKRNLMKCDTQPEFEDLPVNINIRKEDQYLPDPDLLLYYNDVKNRVLWLDCEIDRSTVGEIVRYIRAFNKEDSDAQIPPEQRKPIKIMIMSYGGELDACFNCIDVIQMSKTPVYTYNLGVAFSAGFYILLAGHKRFGTKRSSSLIHQGSGSFSGTASEVDAHSTQYKQQMKMLEEWVLERTTIQKQVYSRNKTKEWYLNGEEQVEYGVVNSIIYDIDELN